MFKHLLAAAIAIGMASSGRADIIYSFSGGDTQTGQFVTYGFRFTPLVDIRVDSLGYFDAGQNGLLAGHPVGIWSASGNLLSSTTVTTENSQFAGATIQGGRFRFTPISQIDLSAGVAYVFGAYIAGATDIWYAGVTNISAAPNLVSIDPIGVYDSGNLVFPSKSFDNTYAPGSFTAQALPEPSALALVLVGTAGLLGTRMRSFRLGRPCESKGSDRGLSVR
jgi:Domain of unknown function (DUF4082)